MNYSDPYEFAMEFAINTNKNIFITGKAGTGKTTFLRKLKNETNKQIAVVAPTGVAAINAGGTTMHSFFQLPFTPFMPTLAGQDSLMSRMKMNNKRRSVIRELEILVIDEISMVRADLLDAVDTILRRIRYRRSEPFGGVQVIFIGDLHQLSPVAKPSEWQSISEFYEGIYFFHSQVIKENPPVYVEFNKIFRQSDNQFIQLLNEVRNDALSKEGYELLQTRFNPDFTPSPTENYITLTTHNYSADQINNIELDNIDSKTHKFNAVINGSFSENSYPVDKTLELKEGAKVMFVKNDTEVPRRFYNGKIGTISSISNGEISVVCPDESDEITVSPMKWENIHYTTNPETNTIEEEIIGTYEQIPLRLAWAITIHKSQGLTFDKAIIDAGKAFSPGQVYVALSRCRSLDGIVLKSSISKTSFRIDSEVTSYSSSKPEDKHIFETLNSAKEQFKISTLLQMYNFGSMQQMAKSWYYEIKKDESSFNDETLPFVDSICKQLNQMEEVAIKFRRQLNNIFNDHPVNDELLTDRLKSSSIYFCDKIEELLNTLNKSTATTDSKQIANDYDENITYIFTEAALKKHLISNTTSDFNVELYYKTRNQFNKPSFDITSYSRKKTNIQLKSIHPELLNELFHARNFISENENLPPYIVAATKTLVQMADFMPQTEKELLKIHGFGKKKVARFGSQFLEIIKEYMIDNDIESDMINFKKS